MGTETTDTDSRNRNPDLLWRVVGDEALLLDAATGNYFSLNPVATEIWESLNAGDSPLDIAARLGRKYSIPETQAREDIEELLVQLRDAELWR